MVAEECTGKSGSRAIVLVGELSEKEVCVSLAKETAEKLGCPDTVVNCAGVSSFCPIERVSEKLYTGSIHNNLDTAFYMTQAVIPYMKKLGFGRIINISSLAAASGCKGMSAYSAAKAGIEAFTRSAAVELAQYGITANCVLPGYINTSWINKMNDEQKASELKRIPAKRFAEPEDIANAVAFFASEGASYVTAQSLVVSGGLIV